MRVYLVKYHCKDNCREAFMDVIKANNIDRLCQQEAGNIQFLDE